MNSCLWSPWLRWGWPHTERHGTPLSWALENACLRFMLLQSPGPTRASLGTPANP